VLKNAVPFFRADGTFWKTRTLSNFHDLWSSIQKTASLSNVAVMSFVVVGFENQSNGLRQLSIALFRLIVTIRNFLVNIFAIAPRRKLHLETKLRKKFGKYRKPSGKCQKNIPLQLCLIYEIKASSGELFSNFDPIFLFLLYFCTLFQHQISIN